MNDSTVENRLKILLVDDEPANVMLLTKMLSIKNYDNVISTLDPKQVVSLYQEHDFDLILLDINMPEMDGYQVLAELNKVDGLKNTQVIALTGNIYPEDVDKGIAAGFSEYLTKPIRIQTLLDIVDKVLLNTKNQNH